MTMSVLVWMSSKLTTSGDTNSGVPTMALTNQRRLLWSRDLSPPTTAHLGEDEVLRLDVQVHDGELVQVVQPLAHLHTGRYLDIFV